MSYLADPRCLQINKPTLPDYLDIFRLWYLYHDTPAVRLKLICRYRLAASLVPICIVVLIPEKTPTRSTVMHVGPTQREIRKMGLNADGRHHFRQSQRPFLNRQRYRTRPSRRTHAQRQRCRRRHSRTCLQWPGSAVVLDVKFENYDITSHFPSGWRSTAIYLFAPGQSNTHSLEPAGSHRLPRIPVAIGMIHTIANILCPTPRCAPTIPMWTIEGTQHLHRRCACQHRA